MIYKNTLLSKTNILKDNKKKRCLWVNNITNVSYIGSSNNITIILRKYYCKNYLKDRLLIYASRIYRVLLEHGYFNFNLEILEYCNKECLNK
jgi:hypothetical protein